MKISKLATLVASLLAVGCLSSCGEQGGGSGALVINFWHTFGKTPADAIEAQAKRFQQLVKQNEGVDVEIKFTYKGGYTDMVGLVTKSFATSDNPTICVAYPDHVADYFAAETSKQFVVNMESLASDATIGFGKEAYLGDDEGIDDFVAAFIDEGRHYSKAGLYSLPYMKSSEVMFYNMTALRRTMPGYNGLTSDTQIKNFMDNLTWDTFMDLCGYVKDNKADIISTLEVPAFYDSDGNFIISKILQNNIAFSSIDANGKGVLDFNGKATSTFTPSASQTENYNKVIALLQQLKAQYDEGLFTTKGVYGEYGSNNFTAQKTMFSIGSSGGAGYNFPSSDTFEVGICPVPESNNNPLYVSQGPSLCLLNNYKVASEINEKMIKYAWKFMKFITNKEVNASLTVNGSEGYIPVRESAYETDTFLNFMEDGENYAKTASTVIYDIDGHYFNTAVFSGSAALRENIASALADTLNSKKSGLTAQQALDNAIEQTLLKM